MRVKIRTIVVSKEVAKALAKHAIGFFDDSRSIEHPNGTVELEVDDDVFKILADDPEGRLRTLLGLGKHRLN